MFHSVKAVYRGNRSMSEPRSDTRARTRQAVVEAAIGTLVVEPTAALADIAAAAGVSRTTVHRYFPERADVLKAVSAEVVQRVCDATNRARLDHGPAIGAIERLIREYAELHEELTLMFTTAVVIGDDAWETAERPAEQALVDAVARGHDDGTIDRLMPGGWVENVIWAQLYTAWSYARTADVPRQDAVDLCVRSVLKALAPSAG